MPTSLSRRALGRVSAVLLAVAALLLLGAGPAAAHTDRGVAASNYAGQVLGMSALMPGVDLQVAEFGDSLELRNRSTEIVTVYGYSDEEYLRIGPDGVWRNANSPATYINLRVDGNTTLPAHADPAAVPDWQQVSTRPEYSWHDHRTHWMSPSLPPQVAADPDRPHRVFAWQVPLSYDGTPVVVDGELTWSPPPNPTVWWPVYLLIPVLGLLAGWRGRTARPLVALLVAANTAAVWHLVATPQPGLTALDRALELGAASLPAFVMAGVTALAVRAAIGGKDLLAAMLAAIVGFMLLIQGLPDMDILWAANVITGGPVVLARLTAALLIAGGLSLMLGAVPAVRRFRPDVPGPQRATLQTSAPTAAAIG
ncbi:hypothetical protein SAMN05660359_04641 [Geodermatophilus obscurus]|uniref:Uncharacterized protein n=1 Tax=Geodermatophilus obscurus TaxID=1861 RepID=A0A1I5IIM6_9ACTN|nr:hypothetical protein [Geodermatophilus obscurus]SFO60425.1 hypothetical protein SAMN05660359_04641 [Geodermatophilus obscurus]